MYDYQRNKLYFGQIAGGIEDLGARELSALGARHINPECGGIYFEADREALYRINYSARLFTRILAPLASFRCDTPDRLYERAKRINWPEFMSPQHTFAVFSNVSQSAITNSHYASLRLKDAVVDSLRESTGDRPDVDARDPDIWINLHIRKNRAVISLDTSGGSLHRRGYRTASVEAPMQETVAAAILRYTEWDGGVPLYDPMCGSGTLLCEALMHYCRIPPGVFRGRFGFQYLPDYDERLWLRVKKEIDGRIRGLPEGHITGSDRDPEAVTAARENLHNLKYGEKVRLEVSDFREDAGLQGGVIITNPPYGIRTGDPGTLEQLYKELGDFLKRKCTGSTAYVYFGERAFIKNIGLKPSWKKPLKTGGLDGRLVKYELF